MGEYDSTKDTLLHKEKVAFYLLDVAAQLLQRSANHDNSKLADPEKATFDEMTPKLATCTYGSEEYKGYLKQMQMALTHHYESNSHHPEHFENGVDGMTLIDLVEMLCDWKAATLRHNDGDIVKSIEINQGRFNIGDQLASIMLNTVNQWE